MLTNDLSTMDKTNKILEQIKHHWNRRAETYQSNMRSDFMAPASYAKWRDLFDSVLGTAEGLSVLDAGCGPGVLSHIVLNHGMHRVVAADISEKMIRIARQNLSPWSDRTRFICRDVTNLALPDAHFDLIVSRCVLWTLPHPEQALKEWLRLLKPGGKIVLIDGNWYRAYYASIVARTWMRCVHHYYRLRNRKLSGQRLADHYAALLPHTHLLRPDWDIGLLTGLGFTEISVQRRLDRIIYAGSIKRLLDPFSMPFMIQASKQKQ